MADDPVVSLMGVAQLASRLRTDPEQVLLVDSRPFLDFNTCHIRGAVNVCCSKIVKRRLQHDKVNVRELLPSSCPPPPGLVVVYDQGSWTAPSGEDSFLAVLLAKLARAFPGQVALLAGGLGEFSGSHRPLCEEGGSRGPLTSLSQPCLSSLSSAGGPTRILPFLFLGSQRDAQDPQLLAAHNIGYELNVSTSCPKPDFIPDAHFLRIPVNDSHADKLRPHFARACRFLDKVRESSGCVLVHCLAGVSRSPTVAIAYVMRHLGLSSDDAYRYVKSKRPSISPNFNFLGQLLEYERELRGEAHLPTAGTSHPASVPEEEGPALEEEEEEEGRRAGGEMAPPLVRPASDPRWSLCRLSLDLRGSPLRVQLPTRGEVAPPPREAEEQPPVVLRRKGGLPPRKDTHSHDSAYRSLTLEDMAALGGGPLALSPSEDGHLLHDSLDSSAGGGSAELEGSHDSGVASVSSSLWGGGAPLRLASSSSSSSSSSSLASGYSTPPVSPPQSLLPRAQSCPVMLAWLASSLDEPPALTRPRHRYSCGSLEAVLAEGASAREVAVRRQTPYARRSASLIPVS